MSRMVQFLCAQHGLSPYLVLFARTCWHPHVPVSCRGACFVPLLWGGVQAAADEDDHAPPATISVVQEAAEAGLLHYLKTQHGWLKKKIQYGETAFQRDKSTHLIYQPAPNRQG